MASAGDTSAKNAELSQPRKSSQKAYFFTTVNELKMLMESRGLEGLEFLKSSFSDIYGLCQNLRTNAITGWLLLYVFILQLKENHYI